MLIESIFYGGQGYGAQDNVKIQSVCSTVLVESIYNGGQGYGAQGNVVTQSVCAAVPVQSIYYGGQGRGSAETLNIQSVCPTKSVESIYYGGYGYGSGFTTTQVSYDTYTEGTLLIAMIDKNTNKLVWQGTGVKTIDENASPQKREENINYGVNQIMANYPPKSK